MFNHFENAETLDNFLDSNESEAYRDQNFVYLMFDIDTEYEGVLNEDIVSVPYWVEEYQDEKFSCQYINGYYENLHLGDIVTFENKQYKYIDSILLPAEMEHQADNGEYVYEYRGFSFMRIFEVL